MNRSISISLSVVAAALLAACAAPLPSSAELDKLTQDIVARSFRAQGQAKMDRLSPDEDNRLCAESDRTGVAIDAKTLQAIEARNMQTIKHQMASIWATSKQASEWPKAVLVKLGPMPKILPTVVTATTAIKSAKKNCLMAPWGQAFTTTARSVVCLTPTAKPPNPSWNTPGANCKMRVLTTHVRACRVLVTKAS